ncbi:unknown [[Mannheimia] succiniciproducens MBEL55E]|uniref:Uncharacterized protein n=1 Tax=Mannheimia succiniciproducens (strain KCTC 0769BP / MBEL55E) TaxID=221988 RepID=Q65PY7_MANSM|nr:unknown [[Mannheimia] succiniciproducens MBEL55E]
MVNYENNTLNKKKKFENYQKNNKLFTNIYL